MNFYVLVVLASISVRKKIEKLKTENQEPESIHQSFQVVKIRVMYQLLLLAVFTKNEIRERPIKKIIPIL